MLSHISRIALRGSDTGSTFLPFTAPISSPFTHLMSRRLLLALFSSLALTTSSLLSPQPADAYTYNCVNVVLRDPYWGQYRRVVESGGNAAGVGPAFAHHGWVVDNTPAPGAIMVWPAGYFGASGSGHVGVVVEVYAGSVLVRHENWPYGSPEHLQVFPFRPGYQYVHRPEAVAVHEIDTEGDSPLPLGEATEGG